MGKTKNQNSGKVITGWENYTQQKPKWQEPREIFREISEDVERIYFQILENDGDIPLTDYKIYKSLRQKIEGLHKIAHPHKHKHPEWDTCWEKYRDKNPEVSWLTVRVFIDNPNDDDACMGWGGFIEKAKILSDRGNFWPYEVSILDIANAHDFVEFLWHTCNNDQNGEAEE